jgi:acetylornithine deacetylase/succinyl-diaminopimelate desuccinylase-like protein
MPPIRYRQKNALETLGAAPASLSLKRTPIHINPEWRDCAAALQLATESTEALVDPKRRDESIEQLAGMDPAMARDPHAATHLTTSANVIETGTKANVVADRAVAEVWQGIAVVVETVHCHRNPSPTLIPVATDARCWRTPGTVAYGVGLFNDHSGLPEGADLFHGNDERVSVKSVRRTTHLYTVVLDTIWATDTRGSNVELMKEGRP